MATIKFSIDKRRANADGRYPIRLSIAKGHETVYIGTDINLNKSEWSQTKGACINHPNKILINRKLQKQKLEAEYVDLELQMSEIYERLTAKDLKAKIVAYARNHMPILKGDFEEYFIATANKKSASTRDMYLHTLSRIKKFCGSKLGQLCFSDITPSWLGEFEKFLAKTAPSANARSIHLRNIRSVINSAITDEITTNYPFRRFKIKQEKTRHRALSVERLRELFNYDCEEYQRRHIDMFKLSFYLIGINMADMARLKEIEDGRIHYSRCKTHKLYSIKVEPEALEIIKKYRGKDWLIDILDRYNNHRDYTKRVNRSLQSIGQMKRSGLGGKKDIIPAFPGLSMYWARHTWATIASKLKIPLEVIADALGHSDGRELTRIYIEEDKSHIDRANRIVIDYVLHDKITSWY